MSGGMLQPGPVGGLLLAAALVLALTGCATTRATTPDVSDRVSVTDRATGIIAIGDFGVGGPRQRSLGTAIRRFERSHPARLLVTLGDNDYTRSPYRFRRNWRESFGWLRRARLRVAGTIGNHDVEVGGGRYQLRLLGMPRRYYTRRLPRVQLFLLDSNAVTPTQTAWLRRALAASTARWKIAAFHHPPFTCGGHESADDVRRQWVPLFERYDVQLVLSGHDHNYQRFARRRGVTYVVHGGGGAPLYRLRPCPRTFPRRAAVRLQHGFLYLRAGKRALRGFALTLSGHVVDRFMLSR